MGTRGAAGIPAVLVHVSWARRSGSPIRHFFTKTIEPIGALMQEELSDKLEVDFEFYYPASCAVRH